MALPAGTISISDINLEQGNAANRNVSLGTLRDEWYVATGDPDFSGSGAISMSAWREKSWAAPEAPTAPVISIIPSSITLNKIDFSITAPNWKGQQPVRYEVSVNDGTPFSFTYMTGGHSLTGLFRGTQYSIKLRAVSEAGTGPYSTTVVGTTLRTVIPTITHAASGGTSATVTFTHPTYPVASYDVGFMVGGSWNNFTTTSMTLTRPLSNVTRVRVRANYNSSGATPAESSAYAEQAI